MSFLIASLLWTMGWWFIAWSHIPLFSEYSFFPLWLGYIFSINAISGFLFQDSLLKRMKLSFAWLFIISIPAWWFFEYLNIFVQNWHYLYRPVSPLHYFIQSSVDFSTVVPAVLSAAFLFYYFFTKHSLSGRPFTLTNKSLVGIIFVGVASLCLMPFFPNQTFPLVWVAPFLIIDPFNYIFGFPSILGRIKDGKWLVPVSAMLAGLFTGFFWEMWNFWSYPKWFYTIPYVGFWKIFEMPLLGYGGYLFFALIIWSYSVFIFSIAGKTLPIQK